VLRFARLPADDPVAASLIEAMIHELTPLYGRIDVPEAPSAAPADFRPPAGVFLVGSRGETAICAGGIKRLSATCCEIKRMFVVPEARGRGVAGELLAALEQAGRELGYGTARLDTGPHQPHARSLYLHRGYRPIEDYNDNPFADFWGEKDLVMTR